MELSSPPASSRSNTLQETVVTLPLWAIAALTVVVIAAMGVAIALLIRGPESMHAAAGQMLVVLLPMSFAVVAAIGVRRTSTTQIDELVARFLERTVKQRLDLACRDQASTGFPFKRADLVHRAAGRSYVRYRLDWADESQEPAEINIKMNVYNIELVAQLRLDARALKQPVEPGVEFIERRNLDTFKNHPVLKHFHGCLQGAIEEGYAIRVGLEVEGSDHLRMLISLRQKMQDHFLASPYLKRYFAEDLSIAAGVIFNELRGSGLQARSRLEAA
jgi:hypothetical protein